MFKVPNPFNEKISKGIISLYIYIQRFCLVRERREVKYRETTIPIIRQTFQISTKIIDLSTIGFIYFVNITRSENCVESALIKKGGRFAFLYIYYIISTQNL